MNTSQKEVKQTEKKQKGAEKKRKRKKKSFFWKRRKKTANMVTLDDIKAVENYADAKNIVTNLGVKTQKTVTVFPTMATSFPMSFADWITKVKNGRSREEKCKIIADLESQHIRPCNP